MEGEEEASCRSTRSDDNAKRRGLSSGDLDAARTLLQASGALSRPTPGSPSPPPSSAAAGSQETVQVS